MIMGKTAEKLGSGENRHKSPKSGENRQKAGKITENWEVGKTAKNRQKVGKISPNSGENRQIVGKIAETWGKSQTSGKSMDVVLFLDRNTFVRGVTHKLKPFLCSAP